MWIPKRLTYLTHQAVIEFNTDSWAYLAIDPGETYGWAAFDDKGSVVDKGQFRHEQDTEILAALIPSHLKTVICEDYRNHGWQQQKKWSRNQTSKNIGKVEMTCALRNVPVVLQSNTKKSIGYKWAGLDGPPSNHAISHQYDAYAHGVYWLQINSIRPVGKILMERNNEQE